MEATPLVTPSKGLTKLAIFPNYKCPGLICLALPPHQKSSMILMFEVVLKLKLPKHHFNKKCAPKILFLDQKKVKKIRMIFDIENSL